MKPTAEMYRDQLVRAVVPGRPAMLHQVHQPTVLEDFCNMLDDGCEAKRLLRAKGYGQPWMTLTEIVQLLPMVAAPRSRRRKGRK
jgi:hypothetical protein